MLRHVRSSNARTGLRSPLIQPNARTLGRRTEPNPRGAWQPLTWLFSLCLVVLGACGSLFDGSGPAPPSTRLSRSDKLRSAASRRPRAWQRSRWAVHKRKRMEATRSTEMLHHDRSGVFNMFGCLRSSTNTAGSWREAFAACMPSLVGRFLRCYARRLMPTWISRRFSACYWQLLLTETNPKVRLSLLRVGMRWFAAFPAHNRGELYMRDLARTTAAVVQLLQKDNELDDKSLDITLFLLDEVWIESCDPALSEAVRDGCLRLVSGHVTSGRSLSALAMSRIAQNFEYSLLYADMNQICDHALPFMLDCVIGGASNAEAGVHRMYCDLLTAVLCYSREEAGIRLVVCYYARLAEAFNVLSMDNLAKVVECVNYHGIFRTSPSLLRRIYEHAQRTDDDYKAAGTACSVAVTVMDNIAHYGEGDDFRVLNDLLGYGFLSVTARHFASERPAGQLSLAEQYVEPYRRILTRSPVWKRRFVECTEHGPVGNAVADYGRSIVLSVKRCALYIFKEEDEY